MGLQKSFFFFRQRTRTNPKKSFQIIPFEGGSSKESPKEVHQEEESVLLLLKMMSFIRCRINMSSTKGSGALGFEK